MRLDIPLEGALWKRVGLNSGWLLLGRILTQVQLALFILLVARSLGAAGFGQYTYLTTVVFIGNILTTFGTDTLLIRELARTREGTDSRIPAVFVLQIGLSAAFIAFVFLWSGLVPFDGSVTLTGLRLYVLVLIPLAFFSIFSAVLRAWERMDLYLITNILTVGLQLILAWIALRGEAGILPLLYSLLAAQVAGAVIAGAFCWKVVPEFRLFARADWPGLARLMRLAWPLALLSVLGVAFQRVGVVALSFLAGDAPTGWFSAASRVVEGLKLVHIAVLGAIFPAISHLSSHPADGQDQAGTLFRTAFWILLSLAFLAALLASVMAPFIVGVLFGPAYSPAIPLVRILAWVLVPYTLTSSLSLRLITRGRERSALAAIVAGLTITIGLNYWLIQARNLDGAALAAVLGECILAGIFWALR